MSTYRSPMQLLFVGTLALVMTLSTGCPPTGSTGPQPTFTPGATDTEFGTADDQSGNTYDIGVNANGDVEITAAGDDGDVTFTIDSEGRVTSANGLDGGQLDLDYQDDGSVNVSGSILIDGTLESFEGTIPAGILPTAKINAAGKEVLTAAVSDPLVVCVAVQAFCDLLPVFIDEVINTVAQELLDELGLRDLVNALLLGQEFHFPTGIAAIDNQLRAEVRNRFPIIVQLEGFCTVWELLDLDDFCAGA